MAIDDSLSPMASVICDAFHLFDALPENEDRPFDQDYEHDRYEFVAQEVEAFVWM